MNTTHLLEILQVLERSHCFPKVVIYKDDCPDLNLTIDQLCDGVDTLDLFICTAAEPEWAEYQDYVLQVKMRDGKVLAKDAMHSQMLYLCVVEHPVTTVLVVENRERLLTLLPKPIVNKLTVLP